ncbi:tRNA-splicing endonuclease subunit sen54 [Coniosporium apollinis]|uniref:tRNA-splicing endonuclease subunit sen54 n=1 Tax=Coniosporium apollinis TaxID=61459 RepID=A0ABQ9P1K9_9PEZI|nr:tRNA-splicing endonuclease subunit sen54 [Coniosporium apollinis]
MADVDEDLPQPTESNPPDDAEVDDEVPDFRLLSNFLKSNGAPGKIPKRGEKDFEPHPTAQQASTLEASRQAMHDAVAVTRVHVPKNHEIAVYEPSVNMAYVDKPRNTHYRTMGKAVGNNRLWLLPEEALYLLERGTLDIRWPAIHSKDHDDGGSEQRLERSEEQQDEESRPSSDYVVPMSLQGAYATFIGFEASRGGSLTLERYTVFAYLKRLGYVVHRAPSWGGPTGEIPPESLPPLELPSKHWNSGFFSKIWRRLSAPEPRHPHGRLASGPLVTPGLYRSYNDIYRLLQIIPSHDPTAPPTLSTADVPSEDEHPFHITYNVWKPNTPFKKTAPGPPDFYICVVSARDTFLPTSDQLNDLLATVPYDPPKMDGNLYQKLKHGYRNVIIAVVDQGITSFLRVADAGFGVEKLYERKPRGAGGKRGGFRGRGRGRGR